MDVDYAVMPLEGLWWVEDMSRFSLDGKPAWQWTAMIVQPVYIVADLVEAVRHQVAGKKGYRSGFAGWATASGPKPASNLMNWWPPVK